MPVKRWPIKNTGDKKAEVLIYEDIGEGWYGGLTAKDFIDQLKELGDIEELNVRINSVGGSVFEGVAIHNAIARHRAKVIVDIDGIAASAASFIAMAADPGELRIADNARIMIHNAWSIEMGDKNSMRRMADRLESLDGLIADMYMKRATISRDEIVDKMNAESWFTAQEAADAGLVDQVTDASQIDARVLDLSRFKNVPQELRHDAASNPGKFGAVKAARDEAERVAVRLRLCDLRQAG